MSKWIDAEAVNKALDRIREEVWLHDIPSPTVPEYIEHHETMQRLMLVIDKERKRLDGCLIDVDDPTPRRVLNSKGGESAFNIWAKSIADSHRKNGGDGE